MANIQRVIFLDVDGVLNANGHYLRTDDGLEPHLVRRVEALRAATNADVVLSTAWREFYSQQRLKRLLDTNGLNAERVIGRTPILQGQTRGAEIATWLRNHASPVRFVVLDDNDHDRFDMTPVRTHLVKTDAEFGFTRADHRRAQQLLTAGPVWQREPVRLAS